MAATLSRHNSQYMEEDMNTPSPQMSMDNDGGMGDYSIDAAKEDYARRLFEHTQRQFFRASQRLARQAARRQQQNGQLPSGTAPIVEGPQQTPAV
ncbi:hypothetical protein YB2330_001069 [Saitoella coloradoensis]